MTPEDTIPKDAAPPEESETAAEAPEPSLEELYERALADLEELK